MGASDEWLGRVKGLMKAELKRRDVSYGELAHRLMDMGIPETEASVTTKLARGTFPTWFFFCQHEGHRLPARPAGRRLR